MLAITDIALLIYHAKLTGMMDFKQQSVPDSFYGKSLVHPGLLLEKNGILGRMVGIKDDVNVCLFLSPARIRMP